MPTHPCEDQSEDVEIEYCGASLKGLGYFELPKALKSVQQLAKQYKTSSSPIKLHTFLLTIDPHCYPQSQETMLPELQQSVLTSVFEYTKVAQIQEYDIRFTNFVFRDKMDDLDRACYKSVAKKSKLKLYDCVVNSLQGLYSILNSLTPVEHLLLIDTSWGPDILRVGQEPSINGNAGETATDPRERFRELVYLELSITDPIELQVLRHLKVINPSLKQLDITWSAPWNDEIATEFVKTFNIALLPKLKTLRLKLSKMYQNLEWINCILPDVETLKLITDLNTIPLSDTGLKGLRLEVDCKALRDSTQLESDVWRDINEKVRVLLPLNREREISAREDRILIIFQFLETRENNLTMTKFESWKQQFDALSALEIVMMGFRGIRRHG